MNTKDALIDKEVGDKVRFAEEKQAYTIQAKSNRYLVCTKPFNPRRTVLYTVLDLEQGIRGTENLVFGFGAETREQCVQMLERLDSGESEVSYRNRITVNLWINT